MFTPDIGTRTEHIEGKKNYITNFLSQIQTSLGSNSPLNLACLTQTTSYLPSFPSESRAALAPLLFTLEQLSKHSYNQSAAWTSKSQGHHYLIFCEEHNIKDPYLLNVIPARRCCTFFTAYAVWLTLGNTLLSITIKSGTMNTNLHVMQPMWSRWANDLPMEWPMPIIPKLMPLPARHITLSSK